MFAEKEIIAYRNIKAPDALREKIIARPKSYKKTISFIATIAACLVLIISGMVINNQSNIVVNGQKLNDSVEFYYVATAMERTVNSTVVVPIQVKAWRDTKISVLSGTISLENLDQTQEVNISSPKEILWKIEPQDAQGEFEMLIEDKKGVKKVTLKYDNTKVTVTKEKEK